MKLYTVFDDSDRLYAIYFDRVKAHTESAEIGGMHVHSFGTSDELELHVLMGFDHAYGIITQTELDKITRDDVSTAKFEVNALASILQTKQKVFSFMSFDNELSIIELRAEDFGNITEWDIIIYADDIQQAIQKYFTKVTKS